MLFAARTPGLYISTIILATWNPSDKSANITLSGGNLIATLSSATFDNVRATKSASAGKYYYEITNGAGISLSYVGVAASGVSLTSALGNSTNTVAYGSNGNVNTNGSFSAAIGTYTDGDRIDMALDLDNGKVWFRKNGGNWNADGSANPTTNTNGIDINNNGTITGPFFPAGGMSFTTSQTANFGGSTYTGTPPSGFGNW